MIIFFSFFLLLFIVSQSYFINMHILCHKMTIFLKSLNFLKYMDKKIIGKKNQIEEYGICSKIRQVIFCF